MFIFPIILENWQLIHGIDNFKLVMICVGVLYGIGFMVMCYKVKEGKYPKPPAQVDSRQGQIGAMEKIRDPSADGSTALRLRPGHTPRSVLLIVITGISSLQTRAYL